VEAIKLTTRNHYQQSLSECKFSIAGHRQLGCAIELSDARTSAIDKSDDGVRADRIKSSATNLCSHTHATSKIGPLYQGAYWQGTRPYQNQQQMCRTIRGMISYSILMEGGAIIIIPSWKAILDPLWNQLCERRATTTNRRARHVICISIAISSSMVFNWQCLQWLQPVTRIASNSSARNVSPTHHPL
jgi:hypothetical protein